MVRIWIKWAFAKRFGWNWDKVEFQILSSFYPELWKSKLTSISSLIKLRLNLDKRTWTGLNCIAYHWLHWPSYILSSLEIYWLFHQLGCKFLHRLHNYFRSLLICCNFHHLKKIYGCENYNSLIVEWPNSEKQNSYR